MGHRGIIITLTAFLLLAACGSQPDPNPQSGGGTAAKGSCKTPTFEVNIVNLPPGLTPTLLSIEVTDDKGKKVTVKGQAVGKSATAYFTTAAALGRKYKGQLFVNGTKYGSAISVPFKASQCSYNTSFDADSGEVVTGG